jgi:Tfp pilus assembly PilM family ATPase
VATTLGIDIGKRHVRGALLRTGMRRHEVERYIEVPIPAIDENAPQTAVRASAVRELYQQLGTHPDSVIASLDGSRASLRVVQLPLAAKKRAAEVLPFELDPLLPFPVDEALVDFQEVRTVGSEVALLSAAVQENVVKETLDELAALEVVPRELAVGAAALDGLVAFLQPPTDEAWLLLHLDLDSSEVCVVRDGSCELARTLDDGSADLRARRNHLQVALQQTIMKYRSEGGIRIAKILLMGEDSADGVLAAQLEQSLSIPCERLPLPAPKTITTEPSPAFGKALALAARGLRRGKRLDMRRGKFAPPRGVSQLREYGVLAACCVLALVLSYSFRVWAEYRVLGEERDALQEKLAQVTEHQFGEPTRSPKRARELLEGGGSNKDPLPRFDALRALGAISGSVPASVTHDTRKLEIELDETGQTGTFELQGQLPDLSARDQVADALDAHECIEGLERGKTSTVPGQERKSYTLSGVIACPGAAKPKGKPGAAARGGR